MRRTKLLCRSQFSLRTLLAATAMVCAASAFVAWLYREPRPVYDVQVLRCQNINLLDAKAELRRLIIRNRPSLKSQVDIGSDPDNHLLFLSGQKKDVDLIHSIANSLGWQKEPVCHYIYCDAKITFFEQMGSAPPTKAGGGTSQILVGRQFGSSSSQGCSSNRIEDSPEHWQPNIFSHLAIESADADFAQVDFLFRVNHFAVDASGAEDCDGTVELHRKMKVAYGKPFEMRIADLDNPDKIHCVQWTIQPPMSMEERNKLASQKAKLAHDLNLLFAAALQAKELCLCWIE